VLRNNSSGPGSQGRMERKQVETATARAVSQSELSIRRAV
jgi:hypothetical protein